jgi:hypothetical protein
VTLLESRTLHQPEKLWNVSKNDYVFTPSISIVNENIATLSAAKSIECSSFTAPCRNFVQAVHLPFTIGRGLPRFCSHSLKKAHFYSTRARTTRNVEMQAQSSNHAPFRASKKVRIFCLA